MASDLSIKLGNFLYKNAFGLYKPLYHSFKKKQDAFEISLLKKYIKKGDTILDIGANIGFYARILSEITGPTGIVHCFEPDKTNFDHLKNNCGSLKNVRINNLAAGPKTETIRIYTSKDLNVDHRTYKPEEYESEIEIEAIQMDEYIKPGTKVDFIKMDIQGFEMQAIQGMKNILANNPYIKMVSEFWPYGLEKAGSSVTDYFNFLTALGFKCFLLEKESLVELNLAKVKSLEGQGKEHYYNIFATRSDV